MSEGRVYLPTPPPPSGGTVTTFSSVVEFPFFPDIIPSKEGNLYLSSVKQTSSLPKVEISERGTKKVYIT